MIYRHALVVGTPTYTQIVSWTLTGRVEIPAAEGRFMVFGLVLTTLAIGLAFTALAARAALEAVGAAASPRFTTFIALGAIALE